MSGYTPLDALPVDLPMLPLRDVVVFPHMVIPLFVGRPKSIKALEAAMEAERRIMLVAQKTAAKDEPLVSDMFDMGCVSTILQMLKLPDGTVKVLVEGHQRASVNKIEEGELYFSANITPIEVLVDAIEKGVTTPLSELLTDLQTSGVSSISRNGILGDPTTATAEHGNELLLTLIADLAFTIDKVFKQ